MFNIDQLINSKERQLKTKREYFRKDKLKVLINFVLLLK